MSFVCRGNAPFLLDTWGWETEATQFCLRWVEAHSEHTGARRIVTGFLCGGDAGRGRGCGRGKRAVLSVCLVGLFAFCLFLRFHHVGLICWFHLPVFFFHLFCLLSFIYLPVSSTFLYGFLYISVRVVDHAYHSPFLPVSCSILHSHPPPPISSTLSHSLAPA